MSRVLNCSMVCATFVILASISGCRTATETAGPRPAANSPDPNAGNVAASSTAEPDFITVQHILIGFEGSVPGKGITRSKADAEALATKILAQAQSGEKDFGDLVREYTDDAFPGIYSMANDSVPEDSVPQGVFPRRRMVPAFGNVGFPLKVGEIGIANFDPTTSKFGWHIIKRIK